MEKPHRIDVHHHPTPAYELMQGRISGSPGIANWTAEISLADMDKNGIAAAVLSLPNRGGVWRGEPARGRAIARKWNDFMARQASDHPGRFGFFAAVPILDIEGSLREAEYALDTLKADGITLMTNMGDKWLGDPHYFPLFEELDRRKAVIYTHPISADCVQNAMLPEIDDSVIEFTADTSRAIAKLLFSGAAHRFKDIHFIFSHAGGTMPFILERFTRHALGDPALAARVPDGAIAYLKRFYYDTAQAAHPSAMASITQFVAITQFLFGTDFPFRNAADHVNGLKACGFSDADMLAIECDNARRLFPRLRA